MVDSSCRLIVLVLTVLFSELCCSYVFVDKREGAIEAGEILYYTISVHQVLILSLVSDVGDADIFVSRVTDVPDSDNYEYASTSTGLDILAVPPSDASSRLSIGIQGHPRYDITKYRLFVLTPSERDYQDHQVWEVDPETGQGTLIIGMDTLWLANEPQLHTIVTQLAYSGYSPTVGHDYSGSTEASPEILTVLKNWFLLFIDFLVILVDILG